MFLSLKDKIGRSRQRGRLRGHNEIESYQDTDWGACSHFAGCSRRLANRKAGSHAWHARRCHDQRARSGIPYQIPGP